MINTHFNHRVKLFAVFRDVRSWGSCVIRMAANRRAYNNITMEITTLKYSVGWHTTRAFYIYCYCFGLDIFKFRLTPKRQTPSMLKKGGYNLKKRKGLFVIILRGSFWRDFGDYSFVYKNKFRFTLNYNACKYSNNMIFSTRSHGVYWT